jgi:putative component of membrane protein insertase Oxa1/YidC/SpoIIIJ protein YidD
MLVTFPPAQLLLPGTHFYRLKLSNVTRNVCRPALPTCYKFSLLSLTQRRTLLTYHILYLDFNFLFSCQISVSLFIL